MKTLEERAGNRLLHSISLTIATLAADCEGEEQEDLIMAYRCIRRHIGVNPNTGKRFGAPEAHNMLMGKLD